jgi:hypothetical protein
MGPKRSGGRAEKSRKPKPPATARLSVATAILVVLFYGVPLLAAFMASLDYRDYLAWLDYGLAFGAAFIAVFVGRTCNVWVFLVIGLGQRPVVVLLEAAIRGYAQLAELSWSAIGSLILTPVEEPLLLGLIVPASGIASLRALGLPTRDAFKLLPLRKWLSSLQKVLDFLSWFDSTWKTVTAVGGLIGGILTALRLMGWV